MHTLNLTHNPDSEGNANAALVAPSGALHDEEASKFLRDVAKHAGFLPMEGRIIGCTPHVNVTTVCGVSDLTGVGRLHFITAVE